MEHSRQNIVLQWHCVQKKQQLRRKGWNSRGFFQRVITRDKYYLKANIKQKITLIFYKHTMVHI